MATRQLRRTASSKNVGAASVQVLDKVAAVLDCLAHAGEMSAAELATALEEPRSTVYRLLSSLQQLGFVEQGNRRGAYRLGLKLFRLGSAIMSRFDERQAALPIMERIHDRTGETVFLCVLREQEAVCIERIDGRRVQSLVLRLGGSLPLHACAAPRVLLAFQPRKRWNDLVASNGLESFTDRTPATREALFTELEAVLRDGYAVSDEDVTPGIAALGAPVFDHTGSIRAALSISGIRGEILGESVFDEVRELVVAGASEISRQLGFDESAAVSEVG